MNSDVQEIHSGGKDKMDSQSLPPVYEVDKDMSNDDYTLEKHNFLIDAEEDKT